MLCTDFLKRQLWPEASCFTYSSVSFSWKTWRHKSLAKYQEFICQLWPFQTNVVMGWNGWVRTLRTRIDVHCNGKGRQTNKDLVYPWCCIQSVDKILAIQNLTIFSNVLLFFFFFRLPKMRVRSLVWTSCVWSTSPQPLLWPTVWRKLRIKCKWRIHSRARFC